LQLLKNEVVNGNQVMAAVNPLSLSLSLLIAFIIEEYLSYFITIEFDFSKIVMFNVIFNVLQNKKWLNFLGSAIFLLRG
jgi:hypothetical protein